ncbi:NUDIX domain-containing protein [Microbacterium sp. 22303]|uniref:NUDIX domain-containing protein n=1 Tax=Microbacterium sp. 22303 TaxID=3453905 RepID=UPI003F83D947
MSVDRSYIRVKVMLIAPSVHGDHHLVSVNAPSRENPLGYHRLIGGSVELGETHREAIVREVDEELGARILDLTYLRTVENIFHLNGELGHEIVALYSGNLEPAPATEGGTLMESDGSVIPVAWRPFDDSDVDIPLYPSEASDWIRSHLSERLP